jgi:hypothetical protein
MQDDGHEAESAIYRGYKVTIDRVSQTVRLKGLGSLLILRKAIRLRRLCRFYARTLSWAAIIEGERTTDALERNMPIKKEYLVMTPEVIAALTDTTISSVYNAVARSRSHDRMKLDLTDLDSVITWLCAHAKPELRRKWAAHAAKAWLLDDDNSPTEPVSDAAEAVLSG